MTRVEKTRGEDAETKTRENGCGELSREDIAHCGIAEGSFRKRYDGEGPCGSPGSRRCCRARATHCPEPQIPTVASRFKRPSSRPS
eukprot:1297170-Pleurochrysis_carterae.AAC.1